MTAKKKRDASNVTSLVERAEKNLAAGHFKAAEALLENALRRSPGELSATCLLCRVYITSGRLDEAERAILAGSLSARRSGRWYATRGDISTLRGDLDAAIANYREALALGFAPFQLLDNLATALRNKRDLTSARLCLDQALRIAPQSADLYANLGDLLQLQGDLEGAQKAYRSALDLNPRMPLAAHNLGVVAQALGRLDLAADSFRQAIALDATSAPSLCGLGSVLQATGQLDAAMTQYLSALKASPAWAEAYVNIGTLLAGRGEVEQALALYRHASSLQPDMVAANLNLGKGLAETGRLQEAVAAFGDVLRIDPGNVLARVDMGAVFEMQGRPLDAVAAYRDALAMRPELRVAHANLGNALRSLGRLDEAVAALSRAVALAPDPAQDQVNLAMVEVLSGRLAAGWRRYEWRFDLASMALAPDLAAIPRWRGEPLEGRRILLFSEQGLGDTLQFLRYVPMVTAAGGRVLLRVQAPARRLAAHLGALEPSDARAVTQVDLQCPLMSLPMVFGTEWADVPAAVPYLAPPERARDKAAAFPWPAAGLRVGLVWAGNPTHRRDRFRSIDFAALRPLVDLPKVRAFSLQLGLDTDEFLPGAGTVVDLSPSIDDLADTAALIEHLDLVISVDTAVAHLAGALGKPVWILLPSDPDFRWLRERNDSPWYPSAVLFRQAEPGRWDAPLADVAAALARLAA